MDGMREHEQHEHNDPPEMRSCTMTDDWPPFAPSSNRKPASNIGATLEELAEDPQFAECCIANSRARPSEWDDSVDRRFPEADAASLAFAGLSAAAARPSSSFVPYVKQPKDVLASRSFMPQRCRLARMRSACWWRATKGGRQKSRQPRPSVQPWSDERLRAGLGPESLRSGSRADGHEVRRNPDVARFWTARRPSRGDESASGAGFRILTGIVTSPTLAAQIQSYWRFFRRPSGTSGSPLSATAAREREARLCSYLNTVYRPEKPTSSFRSIPIPW